MDYSITAQKLIENLGGQGNIRTVTHCMTRLRFVLNDESIVDDKVVENIPGVMGVMKKSGQYQVIIGNNVAKCYQEITKLGNFAESSPADDQPKEKQNPISVALDFIAGCMTSLIPAIIAGGLMKVIAIIFGPSLLGILETTSDTYIIINAIGDAAFYFLPVFIAYTAAKKLNCNTFLSVMVAAMLLHPDIINLLGSDEPTRLFGFIPVIHGSYTSSVIPAMLSTILLKYVEIFVEKITPEWSKNFLKPLLIVAITAPITLCVLAPIGLVVGNGLQYVLNGIYNFAPWLAMALFAGFMPFIVMTGMHWAFSPTCILSIATVGFDTMLLPAMLASNLAQAGATFGVAFKTKDRNMKQIAFPAGISALLAGVTEPAMYGVTLRLKKPMYAACLASGIGGFIAGLVQLKAYAFATPCLTAIVQFVAPDGGSNFLYACIIAAASFVLSFIFAFIVTKNETPAEASDDTASAVEADTAEAAVSSQPAVANPLKGEAIPLANVNDPTFAAGILGQGYAVIPSEGNVYAPFDGSVETLMDTHHALGLTSKQGTTLLIHVGLETVSLGGKYFTPHVKQGDTFKKGDLLLSFDLDSLKKEGFDTSTPVIITNTDDYQELKLTKTGEVNAGEEILTITK